MTTSVSGTPAAYSGRGGRDAVALVISLLAVSTAAGLGIWANSGAIDGWYELADKPPGTPPGWVFGPVWTTLYAAMAVAAWMIWRRRRETAVGVAVGLYAVQLVLNAAWSPVFFGAEALWAGVVVIGAMDIAVTMTIAAFARISRTAALLLVPYLAWIAYATYLATGIAQLN